MNRKDDGTSQVKWVPLGELPTGGEGIINFDEINTADPSVMAAAMRLILTRRLGEYTLPEGWRIMATGNRIEDAAAANAMPTALADRFMHVTLETGIEDWSAWAIKAGVPMPVIAFLKYMPHHLYNFSNNRIVNTTNRGWRDVGKVIDRDPTMENLASHAAIGGRVGVGAAAELRAFIQTWYDLPDTDKILSGELTEVIGMDKPAVKYAVAMSLAHKMHGDGIKNGVKYMMQIGPEFAKLMLLTAIEIHDDLDRHADFAPAALSMGALSSAA